MTKCFLFLLLVIFGVGARAEVVTSCDGNYLAKINNRHEMVVERGGQRVGAMKIDHAIDGGVFSFDDSILIIFGLPNKIDVRSPQVTHLSVYSIRPRISLMEGEVYGGGVYDASFSSDQKFVVVNNQFGVDVLNIEKRKAQSFGATYVPEFKTQQCEKK